MNPQENPRCPLWSTIAAAILAVGLGGIDWAAAQTVKEDPGTLRSVALIYRHGVISPKYNMPKVPAHWPMGFKQLTEIGQRQMYEEGQALRRKYVEEAGFIDGQYKASEVYVRASRTDRSVQTAQMLVRGLYSAAGSTQDPASTPVRIQTAPLHSDPVLRPWTGKAKCMKYRNFVKSLPNTELYRKQGEKHRDFLFRMAAATGVNEGAPPAKILYEVNEIYEPISALVLHKKPFPEAISDDDLAKLRGLADWNYHHQFLGKGVGRLTGGSFIGEVIKNFAQVIEGGAEGRKLYLYSGHQRTVLGIEAALGIETARTEGPLFHGRVPPLTSHYAFELYETSEGKFAIRLKFVFGEDERIVPIPDCDGQMCPFERFADLMSKVVPDNWRQACGG